MKITYILQHYMYLKMNLLVHSTCNTKIQYCIKESLPLIFLKALALDSA